MAKISKTNLSRGVKLSAQHISDNLSPIDNLIDERLDLENLTEPKVPFYVNYTFAGFDYPVMGLSQTEIDNGVDGNLVFPIPLVPTQEHFSDTGTLRQDVPLYQLDSISISMDLRGEGAAMNAPISGVINPNPRTKGFKINYEKGGEQDIKFSILQKDYTVLTQPNYRFPNNSIFTTTIPATIAFAGSESRVENPYYIFGINKQMNPYKSYYIAFHFPNQNQTGKTFYISNLVISLKFYTTLDTRFENEELFTTNKAEANSSPLITSYNLNLQSPAPYTNISSDNVVSGLQTNLNRIDEFVEEQVTTGYGDKFGNFGSMEQNGVLTNQAINNCAVYDVIVVPMWQGTAGDTGAVTTCDTSGTSSDCVQFGIDPDDYANPNDYTGPIQDIRTIPLFFPFTIHHIFAYHNGQIKPIGGRSYGPFGTGTNSGLINGEIGVGLGTMFQSDRYSYDQIAYLQYTPAYTNIVDKIALYNNVYCRNLTTGLPDDAGVLMQVPLTNVVGNGSGFYAQGVPYYCAGGTKRFEPRSGSPDTQGMENFIEIRWQFNPDAIGVDPWYDDPTPPVPEQPQVVAGFGGHFVYLIGKKLLTTNRNNLQE